MTDVLVTLSVIDHTFALVINRIGLKGSNIPSTKSVVAESPAYKSDENNLFREALDAVRGGCPHLISIRLDFETPPTSSMASKRCIGAML